MQELTLPEPTADEVRKAIDKFDAENEPVEWTLHQIFSRYPENKEFLHTSIKTRVLNTLYSTQIRAVNLVASHIAGLIDLDSQLAAGSPLAVDSVANLEIKGRKFCFFSFASKYCSFHRPEMYPIYDSRADACLWHYKKRYPFAEYHRQGFVDYRDFVRVVSAFREHYGLCEFDFKQLDKYLYVQGSLLFSEETVPDTRIAGAAAQDSDIENVEEVTTAQAY